MITNLREIMGPEPAVVYDDLTARLDPDVGLILTQRGPTERDDAVIILKPDHLAHLHRLTTAMIMAGRPEQVDKLPEEYKGWSGL